VVSASDSPAVSGATAVGPAPARRLYRSSDGRVVAGVTGGLAEHLAVPVLYVRLAFIALTAAGGAGILAYALFWVFAPQNPYGSESPRDRARNMTVLLALGSLTVGAVLLLAALGVGLDPGVTVPLITVGVGVVILWRQADDDARARWRQATGTHRLPGLARAAGGVLLVVVGAGAILLGPARADGTSGGLLAAVVVAVGVAVVSGPWWVRMARDLTAERSARIREQERAEVAAHVHDSVLHTLTLIQRHVDDPREVNRLARSQERELRGWLYRPSRDSAGNGSERLSAVLEGAAAEVEDAHGVAIEVVVVGDCPMDERLVAVRDAAREALVNAAKYAPDAAISVYAEVEPEQVTVFVRDRGPGFALDAVPEDRLGVRQSVIGRMTRHGGTAVVTSGAGEGTEVHLEMPRRAT
jgi:signal transduction histidine kinase/phage shock protein PspC (stress-responsive transcriptional regulator)